MAAAVRHRAHRAHRLWREYLSLPGPRFKRIGPDVSIRIGRDYRALGLLEGATVYWYWIGKLDLLGIDLVREYEMALGRKG